MACSELRQLPKPKGFLNSPTYCEPHCILVPKGVYAEDFLGEMFRVIKERKIRRFGWYRTRHLQLDAWDGRIQVE